MDSRRESDERYFQHCFVCCDNLCDDIHLSCILDNDGIGGVIRGRRFDIRGNFLPLMLLVTTLNLLVGPDTV